MFGCYWWLTLVIVLVVGCALVLYFDCFFCLLLCFWMNSGDYGECFGPGVLSCFLFGDFGWFDVFCCLLLLIIVLIILLFLYVFCLVCLQLLPILCYVGGSAVYLGFEWCLIVVFRWCYLGWFLFELFWLLLL